MSSLYHKNPETGKVKVFDKHHDQWCKLEGWNLTKKGQPNLRGPGVGELIKHPDIYPRTTSIVDYIGGDRVRGLIHWSSRLGIDSTIDTCRPGDEDKWREDAEKEYMVRDAKARDEGGDFHEAICDALADTNLLLDYEEDDPIGIACIEARKWVANHPNCRIADWKTTEKDSKGKWKKPYQSHMVQIGAYYQAAMQHDFPEHVCEYSFAEATDHLRFAGTIDYLGPKNATECWNVYIDRESGKIVYEQHWTDAQLTAAWCMFKAAHLLFVVGNQTKI